VIDKYADDEANAHTNTVLMLRIGGRRAGAFTGIHGHHLGSSVITYVAIDEKRQVIPRVTVNEVSGTSVEYVSSEIKASDADLARGEHRRMDCLDCHNRSGHAFAPAGQAIDRAMAAGRISPTLPFVKREALRLVTADYPDRDRAAQAIDRELSAFYREKYAEVFARRADDVRRSIAGVQAVYAGNIFPAMRVGWGTYPNNLGHEDFPGCFRCHDGKHTSADGRVISQDCDSCHNMLAMEEAGPKILQDLGLAK
jgi:cytochrome c2